jgi:hypothetical protein
MREDDRTPVEGVPITTPEQLSLLRSIRDDSRAVRDAVGGCASYVENDLRLGTVERAIKWANPWRQIIAFVAFFISASVTSYMFLRETAQDAVIDTVRKAHEGDNPRIEPSVKTVRKLEEDVGSVKEGVNRLLEHKQTEAKIQKIEVELELHRQQYQEAIQDWSARKAAGRHVRERPKKSDGHLKLEAELKNLSKGDVP